MIAKRFCIYLVLLLSTGIAIPCAYGQREMTDSTIDMSRAGKNALADQMYFDAIKAKMHDDDRLANELLQRYVAARPDVSDGWYELARIAHGDRRLDKSEEYIKKAIALNTANKWYKEEYATLLADKGMYAEAAEIIAELSKQEQQDANYPLLAAEYYTKAKKFNEAIIFLDKALVIHGGDEDVMMRKMQVYLGMNDVDKAAGVIKELIAKDPKAGRYYRLLGDLYENNKQHEKAVQVYDNAVKIIPEDPLVQLGIAENHLKSGDTAAYKSEIKNVILNKNIDLEVQVEVFRLFIQTLPNDSTVSKEGLPLIRQLVAQHPEEDEVLAFYGDLLSFSNRHDSAMMAYKGALRIKPNNPELWRKLLANYADKIYADSLIKSSERAMRLFPNVAIYSYFNSIGYMNKKQYPQAINAIKRAIDMQPENDKSVLADFYSLLADEYHSNKQDDLSDKSFEKALSFDPENASVLNNYSYYLSERGKKLDDAERMSKRSLDLQPNVATYMDTYGWVQYKKGNFLKAKDYIEKAIQLSAGKADATLYDHLGNICYQLNERDKAMEYWKKAKEIGGGDDIMLDKKISEGKLYE